MFRDDAPRSRSRLNEVLWHRGLADHLQLSAALVEAWCSGGHIPALRVPGGWLISRKALLRTVEAGDRAAIERLVLVAEARYAEP